MELIEEILTDNGNRLQIFKGDLTTIPEEQKVDALVVSAFPNDYNLTPNSLIGALGRINIYVEDLAADKEVDAREQYSCWLSKPVNRHNIGRIICFEPVDRVNPYTLIAGIFEGLINFALHQPIQSIAMPMVITGDQGFSPQKVAKELVNTSLFWLNKPTGLQVIKIVVQEGEKIRLIQEEMDAYQTQLMLESTNASYDFFISYSRKNSEAAKQIYDCLKDQFTLFFDKESIDIGANWLNKINESLDASKRFIVCLSPDYIQSKMCKYEYTFCNLKLAMEGDDYVMPIFLYSATLPFHMQILNYHDAREGQPTKIETFCNTLIQKYKSEKASQG